MCLTKTGEWIIWNVLIIGQTQEKNIHLFEQNLVIFRYFCYYFLFCSFLFLCFSVVDDSFKLKGDGYLAFNSPNLEHITFPWYNGISFRTRAENGVLLDITIQGGQKASIKVRHFFMYNNKFILQHSLNQTMTEFKHGFGAEESSLIKSTWAVSYITSRFCQFVITHADAVKAL